MSKHTLGGFSPPLGTCSAPVPGAVPHISPDRSPFRHREKNKVQDRRDVCRLSRAVAGSLQSECPETAHSRLVLHACLPARVRGGATGKGRETRDRLHNDCLGAPRSGICLTGSFMVLC